MLLLLLLLRMLEVYRRRSQGATRPRSVTVIVAVATLLFINPFVPDIRTSVTRTATVGRNIEMTGRGRGRRHDGSLPLLASEHCIRVATTKITTAATTTTGTAL